MHLLIQLGNKVPLAYFYITLILLLWHYSRPENERAKALLGINNLLYLFFSALTVFEFIPIWWKSVHPILSSEGVAGTGLYSTVLVYMSIYLIITILPTFLAIVFVWEKWRTSIFWTSMVLILTSPFTSLLLRKIWWETKVIYHAKSVEGTEFQLNFFKHIDSYMFLALGINMVLLLGIYMVKFKNEENL